MAVALAVAPGNATLTATTGGAVLTSVTGGAALVPVLSAATLAAPVIGRATILTTQPVAAVGSAVVGSSTVG